MGVKTYKAPVVNNDVPYVEVDPCAGRDNCFINQFCLSIHTERTWGNRYPQHEILLDT